jgi:hypothetical protein
MTKKQVETQLCGVQRITTPGKVKRVCAECNAHRRDARAHALLRTSETSWSLSWLFRFGASRVFVSSRDFFGSGEKYNRRDPVRSRRGLATCCMPHLDARRRWRIAAEGYDLNLCSPRA